MSLFPAYLPPTSVASSSPCGTLYSVQQPAIASYDLASELTGDGETPLSKPVETDTHQAEQILPSGWLKNTSFFATCAPTLDINTVGDGDHKTKSPEVVVVTDSSSNSDKDDDIEVLGSRIGSRPPDLQREPKRRKRKGSSTPEECRMSSNSKRKEKKKKRKHHKHRDKSADKDKIYKPKPPSSNSTNSNKKWTFSNPKPGTYLGDLYMEDRKRDLENLQFNSVYKRQIAKYEYSKSRVNFLGGNNFLFKELFNLTSVRRNNGRYFVSLKKKSRSARKKTKTKPIRSGLRVPEDLLEDIVHLADNEKDSYKDEDGNLLVYDPSIQMYRKQAEKPEGVEADEMSEEERERRSLNQWLHKNPHDIGLWMRFIELQDKLQSVPSQTNKEKTRQTDVALLERKMAILEKAISENPTDVALKMARIRIGRDGLWDRQKMKEEWSRLEFSHINQPKIWEEELSFFQETFGGFRVSRQEMLFDRCLEKLFTVLQGKLLTHSPLPYTEEFLVDCLLWKSHFMAQAGYREKGIGALQASIEFNFYQPSNISALKLEEKQTFFEPFWDSGLPRFGEEGCSGWKSVNKADLSDGSLNPMVDTKEDKFNELENETSRTYSEQSDGDLWAAVERLREAHHWLPWRSSEDVEDPDRRVLFDDIQHTLFPIKEKANQFRLLIGFLKFIGVELLPFESTSSAQQKFLSEYSQLKSFVSLPEIETVQLEDAGPFIDRMFTLIVKDIFPMEPFRTYFSCCHLHHLSLELQGRKDLLDKQKLKKFKEVAKVVMGQDLNRTCLPLYAIYAEDLLKIASFPGAASDFYTATTKSLNMSGLLLGKDVSFWNWISDFEASATPTVIHVSVLRLVCTLLQGSFCSGEVLPLVSNLGRFFLSGSLDFGCKTTLSAAEVARARKKALDLLEQFRKPCNEAVAKDFWFLFSWFGSPLCYITTLVAWFVYWTTTHDLTQKLTAALNIYDKSIKMFVDRKGALIEDPRNKEFVMIDSNLEWLVVAKLGLFQYHMKHSPFASSKMFRQCVEDSLQYIPRNPMVWNLFSSLNSQGYKIVGLRRILESYRLKYPNNLVLELASIRAEFDRYTWLTESQPEGSQKLPEVHSLSRALEEAIERCPGEPILWRLYLKFQFLTGKSEVHRKGVFYRGVRQCPWAKDLYVDFVKCTPEDLTMTTDLMIEKELRVRLPVEELDLLKEAVSEVNQAVDDSWG